jgi:SAM-dependent methyltransferase
MPMDSTRRFANRVADYVKFRPTYPGAVFDTLVARVPAELPRSAADIGSGTAIFSRGLLARGFEVYGVEPNAEMREQAERELADEPRFHSRAARAEATELPDQCVSLIVAAQAFHWFDPAQCRSEWQRLLLPGGLVGLVWNQRRLGSELMLAYETVMQQLPEYDQVSRWQRDEASIVALFGAGRFETLEYSNHQIFDWAGLRGRVLSSSYVPKSGEPGHEQLMADLQRCFVAHERAGSVQFDYVTRLHIGRFATNSVG